MSDLLTIFFLIESNGAQKFDKHKIENSGVFLYQFFIFLFFKKKHTLKRVMSA